jgi:phage baseplate assembly protein W
MSYDLKIVNGDLSISNSGSVETVNQNNKIIQDIKKLLLTDLGDNKYHPNYGSPLGSGSIGSSQDEEFMKMNMKNSIENSIKRLINLQRNQMRYQYVSPAETIMYIKNIQVFRDAADPRMWSVFVSVVAQDLSQVEDTITIRAL